MPYIIRNQQGVMVGHCTNKPGPGNKLPNGDDEIHDFYETDPGDLAYEVGKIAEVAAWRSAQEAKVAAPLTVDQKLASIGLTVDDLKAELAK